MPHRAALPLAHPHFILASVDQSVAALICILEPDALTLRLLGEMLEAEGFTTLRLSEAAGAVAVIQEKRPDVVVLDPDLAAGWALLETIRADGRLRETPVIICTAEVRAVASRRELLRLPPEVSVFTKPFEPQELISRIRGMLPPP